MKFETKYLIRWGIPGWILIFWLLYEFLFLKDINPLDTKLADIKTGFTLLLSLTAIGVPIGYLLHQLYFGLTWVFNKNRNFDEIATKIGDRFPKHDEWGQSKNEDYYQLEYVWHSMLLNQNEETKKYLEERYRYLLSTAHGLGSLFVSLIVSLLGTAIIAITHGSAMNFFYWAGVIIQIAIFLSAIANYKYYSDNLKAFQIKMLKTYL